VLVHELVHVSFPNVRAPWAEEGLATYLEPIIRVRSGLCNTDEVWRSLVEGLPQGQPEEGDGGIDVTDTWGRRYWGGALFWFVADVEIRKRTGNARSLDDALRTINAEGGNVAKVWDLDRVLAMADRATGVEVLGPLRRQWSKTPVRVDLDAIWKSLGVAQAGGKMVYDDRAPLAAIRRGILGLR
jgi:predicted metalloprotease with PDZ domain